jgi:hypothetical protein
MSVQTNVVALGIGHAKSFLKSAHETGAKYPFLMAAKEAELIIQILASVEPGDIVINPVKVKHVRENFSFDERRGVSSFLHPRNPDSSTLPIDSFALFFRKHSSNLQVLCLCGG